MAQGLGLQLPYALEGLQQLLAQRKAEQVAKQQAEAAAQQQAIENALKARAATVQEGQLGLGQERLGLERQQFGLEGQRFTAQEAQRTREAITKAPEYMGDVKAEGGYLFERGPGQRGFVRGVELGRLLGAEGLGLGAE